MSRRRSSSSLYATEGDWDDADEAAEAEYYRQHGDYDDRAADFGVTFLAARRSSR